MDSEGVLTLILLLQHVFFASAKDENGRLLALPLEIHVKVIDINDNPPTCPSKMTVFEVQENEIVGKKWELSDAVSLPSLMLLDPFLAWSVRQLYSAAPVHV